MFKYKTFPHSVVCTLSMLREVKLTYMLSFGCICILSVVTDKEISHFVAAKAVTPDGECVKLLYFLHDEVFSCCLLFVQTLKHAFLS